MTRKEYADSLRMIADFFEHHEEIALPHDAAAFNYLAVHTRSQIASLVRALGTCTKHYNEDFIGAFAVRRMFGSIAFRGIANRDAVCERVEVGQNHIPECVIPAKPEETIPAHIEPIYEWRCSDTTLLEEPAAV